MSKRERNGSRGTEIGREKVQEGDWEEKDAVRLKKEPR